MRFRVIINTGIDSPNCPASEHVADFRNKQHAIGFCDKLSLVAYVVDCFDDTTIHCNRR